MKNRKYLTMQIKEFTPLVHFINDGTSEIEDYIQYNKNQSLPNMEVYFKRIGNKSAQIATLRCDYLKDSDIAVISGWYTGTNGYIIAFKPSNEIDGIYIGYYIKSYASRNQSEYIPMIFNIGDKFIKEFPEMDMEVINSLLSKVKNQLMLFTVLLVDQAIAESNKPKNPYSPIRKNYRTTYNKEYNFTENIPDINYLIKLSYNYHITEIHNHYITNEIMEFYTPEIMKASEREYDLINKFLTVAYEHAKEYNLFEEVNTND